MTRVRLTSTLRETLSSSVDEAEVSVIVSGGWYSAQYDLSYEDILFDVVKLTFITVYEEIQGSGPPFLGLTEAKIKVKQVKLNLQ